MNSWKREHANLWTLGPLSIYRQLDERTHVYVYELYDTTRFVNAFSDLGAAQDYVQQRGWSVAS